MPRSHSKERQSRNPPTFSAPPSYVLPGSSKVGCVCDICVWEKEQGGTIFISSISDLLGDNFK